MYSRLLVCVDQRSEAGLAGRIYHRKLKQQENFCDVNDFVLRVESIFDLLKYPSASTEHRVFETGRGMEQQLPELADEAEETFMEEMKDEKGKKATFIVQVQYRQNATWQGQVIWSEKKQTKQFRSALELIKLIDSATEESQI